MRRLVEVVFERALVRHPDLFDRLGAQANKRFRFSPADLDLSFVIHPAGRKIAVYRKAEAPPVAAAVSGPLLTLLAARLEWAAFAHANAAFFTSCRMTPPPQRNIVALIDRPADL
ncbi:MAG: hypothetical protein EOP59_01750 [Sphingomonadales bacterium]|nr:MAG: hypothetical protein EOP59_01750 [Sphingomonadales bacterium]